MNKAIKSNANKIKMDGVKNNNTNPKEKSFDNPNQLITSESKQSVKKICRICYMTEIDENNDPLIKPCKCAGSMKYIHLKCLLHWLKTKIKVDKVEYIENKYFNVYSQENVQCELCKEFFPHILKHNNKLFNLTKIEQDFSDDLKNNENSKSKDDNAEKKGKISDESYVVLDSMSQDKEIVPYRYTVKFSEDKTLKIGRGLEMNLILNDLSVSRSHCTLELNEDNEIFLKDNNSKFGTLVLLQSKVVEILRGQTLTIQTGRSYFNIKYKTPFSLFTCCEAEEIDMRKTYEKINYKSIKLDKNFVLRTESDSNDDEEKEPNSNTNNNDNNNTSKQKVEEEKDEYEKAIKNNNKKIKIMKFKKNKNYKIKNDTNIQNNIKNFDSGIIDDKISNKTEIFPTKTSKKKKSKSKGKPNQNSDNQKNSNNKNNNNKKCNNIQVVKHNNNGKELIDG
jgi:hypothetical protein